MDTVNVAKLATAVFQVRICQYTNVAGATIYLYDLFLTTGAEVSVYSLF